MQKQKLRPVLLFIITIGLFCPALMGQQKSYTAEELREDLRYMRRKMEANNANLYLYSSKATVDSFFEKLYEGITGPMNTTEFYGYITPINAVIKDGHNYMLPDSKDRDKSRLTDLFFPFNFTVADNRFFITMNLSYDSTIKAGDELLSINGKSAAAVFDYLLERTMRDGYNLAYPRYIISTYFRSYYAFSFGYPEKFNLTFRTSKGDTITKNIDAVPYTYLKKLRSEKYADRFDRTEFEKAIFWHTDTIHNYCLLTIKNWNTKVLRTEYNQHISAEIDAFAGDLKRTQPKNLIIDLRGNQGGDAENGIHLLQYLLDEPFQYLISVKKYTASGDLVNDAGRLTKTWQPDSYHYAGKVYVLTDGGSFSNSAIFANLIKRSGRGTLVGEETGGNGIILSGGDGYYELPHTHINILKITNQFIAADLSENKGRGVVPNIVINPAPVAIIENKDEVLNYVIGLLKNGN